MATVTGTIVHAVIHTVVELEPLDVSHTSGTRDPPGRGTCLVSCVPLASRLSPCTVSQLSLLSTLPSRDSGPKSPKAELGAERVREPGSAVIN